MNTTANFKLFSYFSLFFVLLNLIFSFVSETTFNGVLFIWVIAVNIAAGYLKAKRRKYIFCVALLTAPLMFFQGTMSIIFLGAMILLSIFFIYKGIGSYDYFTSLYEFRNEVLLLIAAVALGFLTNRFTDLMGIYIIIYLLSTIVLLRTLRVIESCSDAALIKKLNIRYSIIIMVSSFVLSIEIVKNAFFQVCSFVYNVITTTLLYIAQVVFYFVFSFINFVFKLIGASSSDGTSKNEEIIKKMQQFKKLAGKSKYVENADPFYFNLLVWAVSITLLIIIILFIFKRATKFQKEHTSFVEEREYIGRSKNSSRNLKNFLARLIKPKSNNEQIRFYYIKYLRLCMKNKIDILKSDTSEDVNVKASDTFGNNYIAMIRNIYIKARYHNVQVDDKSCLDFVHSYDKLRKNRIKQNQPKNKMKL